MLVAMFIALSSVSFAQQPAAAGSEMKAVAGASLAFSDLDVPGFPKGLQLAVVTGDPNAKGPYTVRLKFPAGYEFPPHYHPNAENLTVLSGTFQLAMGEMADKAKLKTYAAGDFLYIPAKHPHFGGVTGATIIQLHGEGPFTIELVKKSQ
jgi:quercetin dioxygenase-like cupin family protein